MRVHRYLFMALWAVFLISTGSVVWSTFDGQVAVENSLVVKALIPEKFGLLAGILAILISPSALRFVPPQVPVALWVLVAWIFYGSLWSIQPLETLGRGAVFLVGILLPFVAVQRHGTQWAIRVFMGFSLALFAISFSVSALGLEQGLMGSYHDGLWRGVFVHKNHFGVFASLFFAALIFNLGHYRPVVQYGVVCLVLVAIYHAGSSAAWGLVALSTFFRYVHSGVGRLNVSTGLSVVVLLLILLVIASGVSLKSDALLQGLGRDSSFSGRDVLWQTSVDFIKDHPYGLGYRTSGGQEFLDLLRVNSGWDAPSSHNGILSMAIDTGILGAVLWLIWLVPLVFSARHPRDPYGSVPSVSPMLATVALMLLANAMVDSAGAGYPTYATGLLFLLVAVNKGQQRSTSAAMVGTGSKVGNA